MTPMDTDERRYDGITERIIGSAFRIHNVLGAGFYEKVYENALVHDLRKSGLLVEQQVRFPVEYDGVLVGEYVADLIVERLVLVETKAVKAIEEAHIAQAINFASASRLPVGLVLNFGQKVTMKRIVGPTFRRPEV